MYADCKNTSSTKEPVCSWEHTSASSPETQSNYPGESGSKLTLGTLTWNRMQNPVQHRARGPTTGPGGGRPVHVSESCSCCPLTNPPTPKAVGYSQMGESISPSPQLTLFPSLQQLALILLQSTHILTQCRVPMQISELKLALPTTCNEHYYSMVN